MFWTNLVKTIAKVLLVVMLIAVFIAFIGAVRISVVSGLITLVGGCIGSFVAVSGIMMICEISENIAAIKNHLTGTSSNTTEPISFNSIAQNLGVNLNNQNNAAQSAAPAQTVTPVQPAAPAQTEAPAQEESKPVDLSK